MKQILTGQNQKPYWITEENKILGVGTTSNGNKVNGISIKLDSNGNLDSLYGSNGLKSQQVGSSIDQFFSADLVGSSEVIFSGNSVNSNKFDLTLVKSALLDGSLDSSFASNGIYMSDINSGNDTAQSTIALSDGSIIIGLVADNGVDKDFGLMKLDPNGNIDSTFGTNGKVLLNINGNDYIISMIKQKDDKIILIGRTDSTKTLVVARFNSNGSIDTSFANNGIYTYDTSADTRAIGVALDSNQKIVIHGSYHLNSKDLFKNFILKLDSSGSLDTTFNSTGIYKLDNCSGSSSKTYASMTLQNNDKIIVACDDSLNKRFLSRLTSNGQIDNSFGISGIISLHSEVGAIHTIKFDSENKLIVLSKKITGSRYFTFSRYK